MSGRSSRRTRRRTGSTYAQRYGNRTTPVRTGTRSSQPEQPTRVRQDEPGWTPPADIAVAAQSSTLLKHHPTAQAAYLRYLDAVPAPTCYEGMPPSLHNTGLSGWMGYSTFGAGWDPMEVQRGR
jgi:hypothetical protein